MRIVNLVQGTPEWHAHRATHLNASDAPAMMGCSPYKTRSQLVRELASGAAEEHDEATLQRFADGHRFEELARPLAEAIIEQELYPCVGEDGKFSASFDGLSLLEDTAFEHKRLNETLREAMFDGCTGTDLPLMYQVQMEHQCMVAEGCERVLFMASEWKRVDGCWELVEERHCWYRPNLELRSRIVTGWAQLEADVAGFVPAPAAAPQPTGRAPETLPSLSIQVTGMVTESNMEAFKAQAMGVLGSINRNLQTDEDFANAEKTVTWCKGVEERIEATKQQVLGQTADIDAVFRTMDDVSAETRRIRLELDKLVTKRKDERRTEIGNNARRAVIDHVQGINETLGAHALPMPATLVADLQAAIKGKRSFASMQDAVDSVVANAKITASQAADRIRANIRVLEMEEGTYGALFPDRVQLCASKAPEDLRNLIAARIGEHKKAEEDRLQRERDLIREEEEAKARKAVADEQAAAQQQPAPVAVEEPVQQQRPVVGLVRTPATAPAAAPASGPRTVVKIKLGDINARIAPLTISADGLAKLGFNALSEKGAAKLYDEAQFPAMCQAMSQVALAAAMKKAA